MYRSYRSGKRRRSNIIASALAFCLLLFLFGPDPFLDVAGMWSSFRDMPTAFTPERSDRELAGLQVRQVRKAPTSYNREAFGERWADVDTNGCDTRNDVLARDLRDVKLKKGSSCVVASGVLEDPYTGQEISFTRGASTSEAVQIDHVVALSDAWSSGAWKWNAKERERFANDPVNLLAVEGKANQDKGAAAADRWLPDTHFQCAYVQRQIAVKTKWHLTVTAAERDAMAYVLAYRCPR